MLCRVLCCVGVIEQPPSCCCCQQQPGGCLHDSVQSHAQDRVRGDVLETALWCLDTAARGNLPASVRQHSAALSVADAAALLHACSWPIIGSYYLQERLQAVLGSSQSQAGSSQVHARCCRPGFKSGSHGGGEGASIALCMYFPDNLEQCELDTRSSHREGLTSWPPCCT